MKKVLVGGAPSWNQAPLHQRSPADRLTLNNRREKQKDWCKSLVDGGFQIPRGLMHTRDKIVHDIFEVIFSFVTAERQVGESAMCRNQVQSETILSQL